MDEYRGSPLLKGLASVLLAIALLAVLFKISATCGRIG